MSDLEELQLWSQRLESDVADLALSLQQVREELADALAGGAVKQQSVDMGELQEWVRHTFGPTFARHINNGWRWCSQWAEHPEAVERLGALYAARGDTPRLVWLRDLDANLAALSSPEGTFASCTVREHRPAPALPTA